MENYPKPRLLQRAIPLRPFAGGWTPVRCPDLGFRAATVVQDSAPVLWGSRFIEEVHTREVKDHCDQLSLLRSDARLSKFHPGSSLILRRPIVAHGVPPSAHTAPGIAMNMMDCTDLRCTYLYMHDSAVKTIGQAGIRMASNGVLARESIRL